LKGELVSNERADIPVGVKSIRRWFAFNGMERNVAWQALGTHLRVAFCLEPIKLRIYFKENDTSTVRKGKAL